MPDNTHLTDAQKGKIKREIDKADQSSQEISCLIADILEITNLPKSEILPAIQERFTPDVLMNNATWKDRKIFYIIRELLEQIGTQVSRSQGVPMPNKIFEAIYANNGEIINQCHEIIKSFQYPNIQIPSYPTASNSNQSQGQSPAQTHHNGSSDATTKTYSLAKQRQAVGSGFYNESSKFTGSRLSGQPLHVVKRKFQELIFEQEIPSDQIVQLMHNCLSGVANDYFYTCIRDVTNDMEVAFGMLEKRFSSKQHHSQALTYLKRLSFRGIKSEKSCSDLEALSIANERILQHIPQCGPSYQGEHQDGHKTQFLADIVDGEDWAQHVLTARITANDKDGNGMDYDTFYSMLTSALTLVENRKNSDESNIETLYGAKYGRPNFGIKRSRFKNNYRKPGISVRDSRMNNKCFICKKPGHFRNECPLRNASMTDIIKARIRESGGTNKAAAEVLFCLAQDEDNYYEYINSNEDDQRNTFESLLTQSYGDDEAEGDLNNTFEELALNEQNSNSGFQ